MAKERKPKLSRLSDRDWDNLMTLASGYLAVTNGDLPKAMARAIKGHAELIAAVKAGTVSTEIATGKVTLVVPEGGGVALRLD